MPNSKTIFRIKKSRDFVTISRITLEDSRLTWEARGLYAFLLAKPDDWETCMAHLIKCSPAGRHKTRRVVNELVKFQYIVKAERRDQQGQFSRPQYFVHESPLDGYFDTAISPGTENRSPVNPTTVKPSTVDHPLLNIHTNQGSQLTVKTTTTNTSLVWPKSLSSAHRESILSLSQNVEHVVVQLLLDELAGQIENIKNPVGYFRTLLLSYNSGEFIPAQALRVQSSRESRTLIGRAIKNAKKHGEERLERLVEQQRKEEHG